MGLTEEMVIDYLVEVDSLRAINNHDVKGKNGDKTGQMPLTISVGIQFITQMLEQDYESGEDRLTEDEQSALRRLRKALESLPLSMGFNAFKSLMSGLDEIQKNLLDSVKLYLEQINGFEKHKLLLKAVVLVLKIVKYDLSKKEGPFTIGPRFFSVQILSDKQRIENKNLVKGLLKGVIMQFDMFYNQENAGYTKSSMQVRGD